MHTKFLLSFDSEPSDIDLKSFNKSLPSNMEAILKDDGIYMLVKSVHNEDAQCQYLVDRELDRYRFLTAVEVKAEMVRRTVKSILNVKCRLHSRLPAGLGSQKWTTNLATQLRLWSMASDTDDEMLKVILYYQIIEIRYPDSKSFPLYSVSSMPPAPLSEAKFVRHLVVHAGEVGSKQLSNYCEYLGLPDLMFDPTDSYHVDIIKRKVKLLENEAKKVIELEL